MEPPKKQPKIENGDIKEMLMTMQFSFINKLKNIEGKIEKLSSKYFLLEQKVESILLKAQDPTLKTPQSNVSCSSSNTSCISANDEEAYPEGSWLGDPNNRELRVRCNISPTDLELINNSCSTPEKMALLLLDYLFDREIQAKSNISGTGKHGKQQLDPLKIYGIKCHISYMFGISNKDWQRIKQNIDSKCRTAFQRKQKGMPLVVKGCRERFPWSVKNQILKSSKPISESALIENYTSENVMIPKLEKLEPSSVENVNEGNLNQMIPLKCEEGCSFMFAHAINHPQIIHTEHGDIQVIQATEEQLEELKQNHHIEILTEADIITDTALNASQ